VSKLASLRDRRCRSKQEDVEEDVEEALRGDYREEYLLVLKQSRDTHLHLQSQLARINNRGFTKADFEPQKCQNLRRLGTASLAFAIFSGQRAFNLALRWIFADLRARTFFRNSNSGGLCWGDDDGNNLPIRMSADCHRQPTGRRHLGKHPGEQRLSTVARAPGARSLPQGTPL